MKRYPLLLAALALLITAALPAPAFAGDAGWQIDTAHTTIGFSVRHLGISNVRGSFGRYTAEIAADPKTGRLTSVTGAAEAASIDTGIEARDNHLKAADFFDAATHPKLVFASRTVTFDGDRVTLAGDLTIKGVTKPVVFSGEFLGLRRADFGQGATLRAGYTAETTINRKDFGLSFNMLAEGVAVVSDTVTITLDVEFFRPAA